MTTDFDSDAFDLEFFDVGAAEFDQAFFDNSFFGLGSLVSYASRAGVVKGFSFPRFIKRNIANAANWRRKA